MRVAAPEVVEAAPEKIAKGIARCRTCLWWPRTQKGRGLHEEGLASDCRLRGPEAVTVNGFAHRQWPVTLHHQGCGDHHPDGTADGEALDPVVEWAP